MEKSRKAHIVFVVYVTEQCIKKSVLELNTTSYPSQDINMLLSFDGKEGICKTCHSKVNQGSLPCQARVNNLYVDNIPTN